MGIAKVAQDVQGVCAVTTVVKDGLRALENTRVLLKAIVHEPS